MPQEAPRGSAHPPREPGSQEFRRRAGTSVPSIPQLRASASRRTWFDSGPDAASSMRRSPVFLLFLSLLFSAALAGQQPNSTAATMTVGGALGPPDPIATNVRTCTSVAIAISGAPGSPFLAALSATGVVQPGSAAT